MVLHELNEYLGVRDAASALLRTFVGRHAQPKPILPQPLLRKLRHGVADGLDDGQRGLVPPSDDFQFAADEIRWLADEPLEVGAGVDWGRRHIVTQQQVH